MPRQNRPHRRPPAMDDASPLAPLPDCLVVRILSLLPLNCLFRLRCVCKLWRSLPFSLLFSDIADSISPQRHHSWMFLFRLLARKENERCFATYKCTSYPCTIAYDRELIGSCGFSLERPVSADCDDDNIQESYRVLALASPLMSSLEAGNLDIVASTDGLLLFSLRLSAVQDHAENNLKLFVYNPLTRDVRCLPATRYAPQRLGMVSCGDGNGISGYRIYSLGRGYRPRTKYLLYSIEVFDTIKARHGWRFLSDVKANLSGIADMPPGAEIPQLGFINSMSVANELGFLCWMPSLDYRSEKGWHSELSALHLATGFLFSVPSLLFKTTFAHMWPCPSGLKFLCGVAQGDDTSQTCGVQLWDLLQDGESNFDELSAMHQYGSVKGCPGMQWQQCDKMPQNLWDLLTCKSTRGVRCFVCIPLVFVVAEDEKEHMIIYNVNTRVWRLAKRFPLLQGLLTDRHSQYFQVYPWTVSFTPNASAIV